jgi:hypothetical protein
MTHDCLPHQVRLMTSNDLPSELGASTQLEARSSAVSGASVAVSVGGGIGAPGWALTAAVDDVDGFRHSGFVTQVTKPLPGPMAAVDDVFPGAAEGLGPEGLAAAAAITAALALVQQMRLASALATLKDKASEKMLSELEDVTTKYADGL